MTVETSAVPERLDYVQALRAVAALAVVTQHIPIWEAGAWGVDLFFIISGFIACYITADSGARFMTKRLIRVVPLYWLGTIGVFCVALALPQLLNTTSADPAHLAKSLAFIPFQKGPNVYPVLYLGWTLNYEMLFYLLFAIALRVSHRWRAEICSALLIALVAVGPFVPADQVALRFWTSPILLEFVYGMFCYALVRSAFRRPAPLGPAARAACTAAGVAVVAAMPLLYLALPLEQRHLHLGLPAALAFVLFSFGLAGRRLPRPVVLLGDASYSLYLFHPYAIKVAYKAAGEQSRPLVDTALALAIVAMCCVLAVLSFQLVEAPLTRALRKRFVDRAERAERTAPARGGLPVRSA